MKTKKRNIDESYVQFAEKLNSVTETHNSRLQLIHEGSTPDYVCKAMDITGIEFWRLNMDKNIEFSEQFFLQKSVIHRDDHLVWRKKVYDQIHKTKNDKQSSYPCGLLHCSFFNYHLKNT
jgi:hypothetical protein